MTLDDHKVVLYRNQPSVWVAEVPAIAGKRRSPISEEFQEKGLPLVHHR